ncbi:hypothetical protein PM082_022732 [Marasmius tenuissimus]|nr:hypothetical protein PM082_022732 [Marasmius tenuissimus]
MNSSISEQLSPGELRTLKKDVNRLRSVNIEISEKWTRSQRKVKELQHDLEEQKKKARSRHNPCAEEDELLKTQGTLALRIDSLESERDNLLNMVQVLEDRSRTLEEGSLVSQTAVSNLELRCSVAESELAKATKNNASLHSHLLRVIENNAGLHSELSRVVENNTSLERNLLGLEETMTCDICEEILWVPWGLACGHTFCASCLTGWFSVTLGTYQSTYPEYTPGHRVIQETLTERDRYKLSRARHVHEVADVLKRKTNYQPRYTCPHCRFVIRSPPVQVFDFKESIEAMALLRNAPISSALGQSPWNSFWPVKAQKLYTLYCK